jgi:hypothetical protein
MTWMSSLWKTLNLPATEAIEFLYRSKGTEWVADSAPPARTEAVEAGEWSPLVANKHYLTVTAQKTVLAYDRVLFTTFYGVAHSTIVLLNEDGEPRSISCFTSLNKDLVSIDKHAGERIVLGPRTLLDSVPFRGSAIGATIALLAVEAVNYSKPLLSTLQKLSDVAGVGFIGAAAAFAEPLVAGMQALSQVSGAVQIAYAGNLAPHTGVFLMAEIDKQSFDWSKYSFASDYSLLKEEMPVTGASYMVITVESATQRPTYGQIPELKTAEKLLSDAVKAAGSKINDPNAEERRTVEDALASLRWQCLNTTELCDGDGRRIADAAKAKIQQFMTETSGGLSRGDEKKTSGFSFDDLEGVWPRPA